MTDEVPTYTVIATLLTPKNYVVGRLEQPYGPKTIDYLCTTLLACHQARPDMDRCRIELRWRRAKPTGASQPQDEPEAASPPTTEPQ
jgi:hypothetical protein